MNNNLTNNLYGLFIVAVFFLALNTFSEAKKESDQAKAKGCYNAPIYVYDEERKQYYRQDWCKHSKQPVYFDAIPVPTNGDRRITSYA